jgi:hypothetical protein
MKSTAPGLIAIATVAISVTFSAPAFADGAGEFQSPSADVFCSMSVRDDGTGAVICEGGRGFVVGKPPGCDHSAWGDRFSLEQGSAPISDCHNDTIRPSYPFGGPNPAVPTLAFGQTQTVGTITCDSEPNGITCTDAGTGHYFRMSNDSNELG